MFKFKLDIKYKKRGLAGRLSNFTRREFIFDGVACRSIEGVLQSFKYELCSEQKIVCGLWGLQAKLSGKEEWKNSQILHWQGKAFLRTSQEYWKLICRLYEEVYEQDKKFRRDVKKSAKFRLKHSIGCSDPKETVLSEEEFLKILELLQKRQK